MFIQNIFRDGTGVVEINKTLISLIPKVPHPDVITQFRPIGLCNVDYKILFKVIVTKIQPLLPNLIGDEQTSFILGRQIIHNVVIVQEDIHSILDFLL